MPLRSRALDSGHQQAVDLGKGRAEAQAGLIEEFRIVDLLDPGQADAGDQMGMDLLERVGPRAPVRGTGGVREWWLRG